MKSACSIRETARKSLCRIFLAAPLLLPLLPGALRAQPSPAAAAQPDVILFTNGDQLTGKYLRSTKGGAVFHSDVAGDVTVSWDKVKEIHSTSKFVVVRNGVRLETDSAAARTIDEKSGNNETKVTFTRGSASDTIPLSSADYVITAAEYDRETGHGASLFSGWTGAATAGATIVAATQKDTTFNGGVSLARVAPAAEWLAPRNRTLLDFVGSYGKITQPGVPDVKTSILHADVERDEYISPRLYALAQAAFDHNFSQDLALQQVYGGGLGGVVIKRPNQSLDAKAAAQFERQSFLNAASSANHNLFASTFGASYMLELPKGMAFTQQVSYLPAWNNLHAYSAAESNQLLLPVYKRLSFSVGTIDSYLNDPAATTPPTKRNSFQFTMGAAYTFAAAH